MKIGTIRNLAIGLAFCFAPNTSAVPKGGKKQTVNIWTRSPGNHTDGADIKPYKLKVVDLAKLNTRIIKLLDIQYEVKKSFKAVSLLKIIKNAATKSTSDLVLLHFENGMIVPVPLESDYKTFTRLNLQIAVGIKEGGKWTKKFPSISKKNIRYKDPMPNVFAGNKLVVTNTWYPIISDKSFRTIEKVDKNKFTPWEHVNSLTGIEFVNARAYFKQFKAKKSLDKNIGFEVFLRRCQYCHGVRGVGSSFGWDYLDPVPIYELRNANNIHLRVKYKFHDSFMRGLLMPNQEDFSKGEASVLWGWLKMLGRQKELSTYRP